MAGSRRQRSKKEGTFLECVTDTLADLQADINFIKASLIHINGEYAEMKSFLFWQHLPNPYFNVWANWSEQGMHDPSAFPCNGIGSTAQDFCHEHGDKDLSFNASGKQSPSEQPVK